MGWEPDGVQDRLLQAYHERKGGRIYTEVYLGSCFLDGVLVHNSHRGDGIVKFSKNKNEFRNHRHVPLQKFPNPSLPWVEAIAVSQKPYRQVIGQADGGRYTLRKHYPFFEVGKTVALVSEQPHSDMNEFAEEKDIEIEVI